jgi:hypothetical protein
MAKTVQQQHGRQTGSVRLIYFKGEFMNKEETMAIKHENDLRIISHDLVGHKLTAIVCAINKLEKDVKIIDNGDKLLDKVNRTHLNIEWSDGSKSSLIMRMVR